MATDPDYDSDIIKNIVDSHSGIQASQDEQINHINFFTNGHMIRIRNFCAAQSAEKNCPGPDDIPYWVYKECAVELSPIITHIINTSTKLGIVPGAWKKAYVTPVPKVRNASEYTSFADLRPISVTPILSRLTEKIVVRKYLWPLMDNEQMLDQFAFRPTGSTTAALIDLMHLLYSMFDQGNDYVRCILIDYSKAFDVVNHEILLTELSDLGLNNSIFS